VASTVNASREVDLETEVEKLVLHTWCQQTANLNHGEFVENDGKVQIYGSEGRKVRVVYRGARP